MSAPPSRQPTNQQQPAAPPQLAQQPALLNQPMNMLPQPLFPNQHLPVAVFPADFVTPPNHPPQQNQAGITPVFGIPVITPTPVQTVANAPSPNEPYPPLPAAAAPQRQAAPPPVAATATAARNLNFDDERATRNLNFDDEDDVTGSGIMKHTSRNLFYKFR